MLKYIKGSGFIAGIPARDLSDEDVKLYGGVRALVATGLYEQERKSYKPPTENKLETPESQNKDEE